jgi:5-dehydro-2-deoxygluconokinase
MPTATSHGSAAPEEEPDLEVVTIGRVSVDLFAEQLNTPLAEVETFRKSLGGTTTNVAIAAARLGRRSATITKVGDDKLGGYVRHALAHTFAVDTRFVSTNPAVPTVVVVGELDPPDNPTVIFYRRPYGPDQDLTLNDVDLDLLCSVPVLWVAGAQFSFEPSASTLHQILEARKRRRHTILDIDWRPSFWESKAQASSAMQPLLDVVTVVVGNEEEVALTVGTTDAPTAARKLLDHGLEAAVIKRGGNGSYVATADGHDAHIDPFPVEVVCGLGAGDAFGGALCDGLLRGLSFVDAARYGNAAGALVAGRLMCADAMPTADEIESVLRAGRVSPEHQ